MQLSPRSENFVLFGVAIVAAVFFFFTYPSQDPRNAVNLRYHPNEIKQKAIKQLNDLGYAASGYDISNISLSSKERLLDSLQYRMGRRRLTKLLAKTTEANLKPFAWQVVFNQKNTSSRRISVQTGSGSSAVSDNQSLQVCMDLHGNFTAFLNNLQRLPKTRVNRKALRMVFSPADSTHHAVMSAVSDSMLSRMLYFDMQRKHGVYSNYTRAKESRVRARFNRGIPYLHSQNDAQALADFYVQKAGWNLASLKRDTVFIKRIQTVNAANVRYKSKKPVRGQHLRLDVVVSPTGALLGLKPMYNPRPESATPVWEIIRFALMLAFLVFLFVLFFFRMRARTINTTTALMVAILMGLTIFITSFLRTAGEFNPLNGSSSWNHFIFLFLGFVFVAAFLAISSFVLYAVSDSLTRQYWTEKLATFDYVLQGSGFSKLVGRVALRSVALAFILCGLWAALLYLFPHLYFKISHTFRSDHSAWAPLELLLSNTWFSFSFLFSIFLVIGSRSFGLIDNQWVAGGGMAAACAVVGPVIIDGGPALPEVLLSACLGLALVFIYLRWDFLTLLISHFLFMGFVGSVTGWIIPGSPDQDVFITIAALIAAVAFMGGAAIYWGKDKQALTEYVPAYVQELAREQRIKQELEIAREVQQSFLPVQTPARVGLDVAALCRPAHETGGDYYDFIPLDDHRLAVAIGDVSGKGIQAAFYMTLVKGMLHSLCRESDSPAKVLCKANKLFYDNAAKGTFISLIYGIIDVKAGSFSFARAGHNPVLHINTSTGEIEPLQPSGLGLGLTRGKIFDNNITEIELSITDDDLFLLYTDGIVEALNQFRESYGTERLISLLKRQKNQRAEAIISSIAGEVTNFIGNAEQHDDMTLMAIRLGKNEQKNLVT